MECVRVVCCLYLGMKKFGLSLQPMIPPKRFDIFSLTGGCSEGLDVFNFSLITHTHAHAHVMSHNLSSSYLVCNTRIMAYVLCMYGHTYIWQEYGSTG